MGSEIATIRTERLTLRPFTAGDLDDLAELCADPEVVRYISDGTTASREETAGWLDRCLDHYRDHGFGLWCVRRTEDDRFLGRCGIKIQGFEGHEEPEIGYILRRDQWGRGYATEAAAASRDYGFDALGFRRLISLIQHDNVASKRVADKIGMHYEREVAFGTQWEKFGRRVSLYSIERSGL
jgi:[ribosomal protein S5]-alanine N-acetyltransferase